MENILALYITKTKVGITILLSEREQIVVFKDIYIDNMTEIVKSLIIQYSIKTILVPYNLNVIDMTEIEDGDLNFTFSTPLKRNLKIIGILKERCSCFGFSASLTSISCLLNYIKDLNRYDCINFLNQKINENSIINRKTLLSSNYISAGLIDVFEIVLLDSSNKIFLNTDTIYSLSIFHRNIHPNTNLYSTCKNDLFNYLNNTHTKIGSERLKQWLLMPLQRLCDINLRLDAIDFVKKHNLINNISNILRNIKNYTFTDSLYELNKEKYFSAYHKLLNTFFEIFSLLGSQQKLYDKKILFLIPNIINAELDELIEIHKMIDKTIDFKGQFIVKSEIDSELENLKNKHENIENILTEIADELNKKYNDTFNIVYIPQLGFLIESNCFIEEFANLYIENETEMHISLNLYKSRYKSYKDNKNMFKPFNQNRFSSINTTESNHMDDLKNKVNNINSNITSPKYIEHNIDDKKYYYYKTDEMKELDRQHGDLTTEIYLREVEILNTLYKYMKGKQILLNKVLFYIASIDAINSLAIAAIENNMIKPEFNLDNTLYLKNARYLFDNNVEPITWSISINNPTIITGRNCSGKSTILRILGYSQILAQIGSYIPCEECNFFLVSNIYTKMASIESKKKNRSSYASELVQIKRMIQSIDRYEKSLLLIDEFGKGCNIYEGTSLFIKIIEQFKDIPYIAVTNFQKNLVFPEYLKVDYYKIVKKFKHNSLESGIYKDTCAEDLLCKVGYTELDLREWKEIVDYLHNENNKKNDINIKKDNDKNIFKNKINLIKGNKWAINVINKHLSNKKN